MKKRKKGTEGFKNNPSVPFNPHNPQNLELAKLMKVLVSLLESRLSDCDLKRRSEDRRSPACLLRRYYIEPEIKAIEIGQHLVQFRLAASNLHTPGINGLLQFCFLEDDLVQRVA